MNFLKLIIILIMMIIEIKGNNDYKYYAIRTDTRRGVTCQLPQCGGYFVKELNTGKEEMEIYISDIFQQDEIGVVNENKIKNAPPFHVIFRGILNRDYVNDVDQAEAYNIYRLMPVPGNEFKLTKDTSFFTLGNPHNLKVPVLLDGESDPKKKFKPLNCELYKQSVNSIQTNWIEYLINTGNSVFTVNSIKLIKNESEGYRINENYEQSRNEEYSNAIVYDYKPEYEYKIDNLFISLTNSNNCPKKLQEIKCVPGLVATYVRSFNHCYIFFECAPKSNEKCPYTKAPICPKGYSLTSIPSYPNGCLVFYCDPSFLFFNY